MHQFKYSTKSSLSILGWIMINWSIIIGFIVMKSIKTIVEIKWVLVYIGEKNKQIV